MRKVHKAAVKMLVNNRYGKPGKNDYIYKHDGMFTWIYHHNAIAREINEGVFQVNWCGWFTQSTTLRIYALTDYLNCYLNHILLFLEMFNIIDYIFIDSGLMF